MAVEEELKKDHSDMQAVVDSKQKIIDAQVMSRSYFEGLCLSSFEKLHFLSAAGEAHCQSRCGQHSPDGGADTAEGTLRRDVPEKWPVA